MPGEFDWWALIGPVPTAHPSGGIAVPHDRTACLDRDYNLGPLILKPGGRRLVEYLRAEPYQLDGVTLFETWPIIVQGKWPSRPAQSDGVLSVVASWLHRAVCLVSFATGENWQVRTSATDMTALSPQVPEDWPAPSSVQDPLDGPLGPVERPLPPWIASAWQTLEKDKAIASALDFWHHGMLLTPTAPSFALVAFCAVVEGVAESESLRNRIKPAVVACVECGNQPRVTERFWSTVGLVRDEKQVQNLKDRTDPYGRRSKTAHGRQLHGGEVAYGSMFGPPVGDRIGIRGFDSTEQPRIFVWEVLPELRMAATDLLRLVMGIPAAAAAET